MKLRHEAFLLFKEGLRSLIDAGTKNCIVHLTAERGKLLFTIEFEMSIVICKSSITFSNGATWKSGYMH
jgi:hypothetical protein